MINAKRRVRSTLLDNLWPSKDILIKLMEESGELAAAVNRGRGNKVSEMGDVLFACLALCIAEDINPDHALDCAIEKYEQHVLLGDPRAEPPDARTA